MSQEQPRRPRAQEEPIKYGDVFDVSGELASKPIAPRDAATMQTAENLALGQTQKGGPAAVMESAAAVNEKAGLVGHGDTTDIAREKGVTITDRMEGGNRVVTEAVGDQVVGQYVTPDVPNKPSTGAFDRDAITVGEALEATSLSAGDKEVDQADAAAITAAEVRATGTNKPGGLGATAQSAVTHNQRTMDEHNKTTVADVLADATTKMGDDKPVTREDAERVIGAEMRNKPDMSTTPGGVAASMATAARLNQQTQ